MIIENKPNVEFTFNCSDDVKSENLNKMETEVNQFKASVVFSNNSSNENTLTLTPATNYEQLNSNNLNNFDLQSVLANSSSQYMPKCPLCEKTFANSSNLKHHMNTIHFNEAKWICNECGKVCTSKSNLKVHLRVHLRVKPYYCRWCDYNCMHHSSIRDHLSKCHPEKSHNSCEPGYIFNSAAVPEPESTHFEPSLKSSNDFNPDETKEKSPPNSLAPSKVFKFKNKIAMKKKLKKKVKLNQNGKKNHNSSNNESLLSESNENSKNNLDENDENGLEDEDYEEDTNNEECDEKNELETNLSHTTEQNVHYDDEDDELKHDGSHRNSAQTRRSSYSISSNKSENANNRRVSYSNISNAMTPLMLSNFSGKNTTTTSSSSSSSSSLSPNTSNKLNALSNLPGLANLIQHQQSTDFLSSLFSMNNTSETAKKSSQIQLNNIASTLMHHLNAAVLFNQYNNNNIHQNSSLVDCLASTGTIPFSSNVNNLIANSNTNLNAALDLTIKSEPNNKKSITECSDEYTSSLSPVSTSSTISSSSLKNSQSFISIKSKGSHLDKRIRDTSMTNNKKSGNKAISDVINRLNLNLPNSSDHEHDDENHHGEKRFSFKKLCTKNMKEATQCDNKDQDEAKQVGQHEQEQEDEDEEYDEEDDEEIKESQLKLNETHQGSQSEPSYKCKYCNIIFTEYPLYSIHAGMHSCKNHWQCSVCGHTCANKIDFNVHILHLSKI